MKPDLDQISSTPPIKSNMTVRAKKKIKPYMDQFQANELTSPYIGL